MTKSIPEWSSNLSVNVPKDERKLLGRLAAQRGARSLAQYVKELIAIGLAAQCQASAAELREIRRRYYGATLALLFIASLVATWRDPEGVQRGCRRCARRAGCRFEECVTVEVAEEV